MSTSDSEDFSYEDSDEREILERLIIAERRSRLILRNRLHLLCGILLADLVFFLTFGIMLIMRNCNRAPGIELKDFTIRDMAVFSTNSMAWQVSSDIDLTLSFRNRNKVPGCFATLLHMKVSVYYAGNSTISVSNLPLEFSLKPKRSVGVSAQLRGERFLIMNNSAGSALAADVRREIITLQLEIATRYSQSNGFLQRFRTLCEVVATTPSETNSRPASLIRKKCVDMIKVDLQRK